MKMILKHILNTSALLLTGIVFAGCSSSDAPIEQPINPAGKYTMTVNASKGSDATTRALSIDGSGKLIASWATTEDVYVKKDDSWLSGSLKPQTAGESSVLKGEITGVAISEGNELTLQFPRTTIDYTGQVGTLDDIAAKYDYAIATTNVTSASGNTFTSSDADFKNQQAIVKFTLKDIYGFPIKANRFTISSGNDKIVQNIDQDNFTYGPLKLTIDPASETGELYTAIRHNLGTSETDDITLTAVEINHDSCVYQKSGVKFESGNYYRVNVTMKSAMLSEPLTLEAKENGKITFTNNSGGVIEYRINDGSWTSTTNFNESVSAGTKVSFRGNNSSYYPGSDASSIACTAPCYVYGNIMSLVNATNFATATSLTGNNAFHNLFKDNTNIINHSSKDLVLPATTLTSYCYKAMFNGCAGLTRAPVLPAPALVANCYEMMFADCTNLKYIKCLATSGINTNSSTNAWVNDVSGSGTFVRDPNTPYGSGTSGWPRNEHGIPSGWTVSPK